MKTKSKPKFVKFQIVKWNGRAHTVYDFHATVDGIMWYYISAHSANGAPQWVRQEDLEAQP